jgi:hypothetical protein
MVLANQAALVLSVKSKKQLAEGWIGMIEFDGVIG